MSLRLKKVRSGPRTYIQIVDSTWRADVKKPGQRFVASLGRIEEATEGKLDGLINGLLRVTGRQELAAGDEVDPLDKATFEPALALGATWALDHLWRSLGLDQVINRIVAGRRFEFPVEKVIRALVFNRLCEPESKLGVLRWLDGVHIPEVKRNEITHQQILRAMDLLVEHKETIERHLATFVRELFDSEIDVVFYDITTVHVTGTSGVEDDLRHRGRSKRTGGFERQFALGVVQTADGFPLMHEVFDGNVAETKTVQGIIENLVGRFNLRRLVFVGDRGMISKENLEAIEAMTLPSGVKVEYIIAIPAQKYPAWIDAALEFHDELLKESVETELESVREARMESRRVIIAHNPAIAEATHEHRLKKISKIEALAAELSGKLERWHSGIRKGARLKPGSAKARLKKVIRGCGLAKAYEVEAVDEGLTLTVKPEALERIAKLDGKLFIVTNVSSEAMEPATLVQRYKSLADIERGFRVMKQELEIGPVYHRLNERIRAHTMLCFLGLVLHRTMRQKLRVKQIKISPEALLYQLRSIQRHRVVLANGAELDGVTKVEPEQRLLFEALDVPPPNRGRISSEA